MRLWQQINASGFQDAAFGPHLGAGLWVVGDNGTIWRSQNLAPLIRTNASGFRRITSVPSTLGFQLVYAVGENGTLWKTTVAANGEGGTHWTSIPLDPGKFPRGLEDAVVDFQGRLWVVGKNMWIWWTTDGASWEWHSPGLGAKRIAVSRDGSVWAIFQDQSLWRGDMSGQWSLTKGSGMADISISYNGVVWLVGANGTVWTTRDGETFENQQGAGFESIAAAGDNYAFVVGLNGTVWTCDLDAPDPKKAPQKPADPPQGSEVPQNQRPVLTKATALGDERYRIEGHNFLPNKQVWIRGTILYPGGVKDGTDMTHSVADNVDYTVTIPEIPSGLVINFTAHDGRFDQNGVGDVMWSNAVSVLVP